MIGFGVGRYHVDCNGSGGFCWVCIWTGDFVDYRLLAVSRLNTPQSTVRRENVEFRVLHCLTY